MRSMTMRGLVLAASMLAGSAQAAATFNNTTFSCGQTLAMNTTAFGLSISCLGALSLSGGSIVSDEAIRISSDTSITLIDILIQGAALTLTAPLIDTQGDISLLSNSTLTINAGSIGQAPQPLTGGLVQLSPGAVVAIVQPSSPSGSLSLQATGPTSPTDVSLPPGGTIVLQNTNGVQFSAEGRIEPSLWSGSTGTPTLYVQSVPEPGTWALMAVGLMALAMVRRRT
ncbi:MAG: PEP-CTERM sorting domain-containing protein [Pseudomonadota bacterium]